MPARKRLGQLLVDLKIIDEHQLQSALGHQKQWGGKLGGILVQKGFCREDQVLSALSQHLGMPAVKLGAVNVDPRAVKTVARSVAEKLHAFAYEISGSGRHEVVSVAMSDPTDLSAIDQLAFHTGKRIKPILAGDSDVALAIQQHYGDAAKAGQQRPTPAATSPAANPFAAAPGSEAAAKMPAGGDGRAPTPAAGVPRGAPESPGMGADSQGDDAPVPVPVEGADLPSDAPVDGLEPIAAHSQGEQQPADGSAPASDDSASSPPLEDPVTLQGWSEQPQGDAIEWSDGDAPAVDQLPADAIVGEAPPAEAQPAADAPDGWHDDRDPLAASAGDGWGTAEPASASDPLSVEEADVEVTFDESSVSDADAPAPAEAAALDEEQLVAEVHAAADSYAAASVAADSAEPQPSEADGQQGSEDAPQELPADAQPVSAEEAPPAEEALEAQPAPDAPGSDFADAPDVQHDAAAEQQLAQPPAEEQVSAAADDDAGAFAFDEPGGTDADPRATAEPPAANDGGSFGDAASAAYEQLSGDAEPLPRDEQDAGDGSQEQAANDGSFAVEEQPAGDASFASDEQAAGDSFAIDDQAGAEASPAEQFSNESGSQAFEEPAPQDDSAAPSESEAFWQQPGAADGRSIETTQRLRFAVPTPDEYAEAGSRSTEAWPSAAEGEWFGDAGALSAADIGTLQSIGIDPAEPAAALRTVAALVRALHRRQLVDLDEIAAEIRDAAPAAAADQPQAETGEEGAPENRWPET